jgi:hypothetical protein
MQESTIYIFYESRGDLVAALELYRIRYESTHTLPEVAASLHMREVILWTNGNVMVFDDAGQQMPEYQGPFPVKAPLINNVFSGKWHYGDWRGRLLSDAPIEMPTPYLFNPL